MFVDMNSHLRCYWWLFKLLSLLLVLTINKISGDTTPIDCLNVSHQSGQDTPQCGSWTEPCQTLPQALLLVGDGGKICLDGRNSERHPYSCFFRGIVLREFGKSVAIYGLFTKAHITCDPRYGNLMFRYPENRLFKLTLYNLVFHSYGVDLAYLSFFNVSISSCRFINNSSSKASVFILQKESKNFTESSIVVTDSEFLFNKMSIYAILFNGLFTLRISRCVYQGTKGRFNGASGNKLTKAAVYIKYRGYPTNTVFADGLVTDCLFRDLGHEDNSFALSFRSYGIYDTGRLLVSNSTFLRNENAMSVVGGFHVQLRHVTINSTYGYALMGGGPPKINARAPDVSLSLDHCLLLNNRIGIRMALTNCLNFSTTCPPDSKILVVNNSHFVGGNDAQAFGDAIRVKVETHSPSLQRPNFIKGIVKLENVTFREFHNSVLYIQMRKNLTGLIYVKNCKFLNNSNFVYRLVEQHTVEMVFDEEDPPKCLKTNHNAKNLWNNKPQFPVVFENSIFENNVAISGALSFFNGNITFKNCTFKDNEGLTLGGHIKMKIGYGRLNIINSNFLQSRLNQHFNAERKFSYDGCFLYSDSVGPLIIRNSSFTANMNKKFSPILAVTKSSLIRVDATSMIKCPSGKWLKMDINKNTEVFKFTKVSEKCLMKVNYVKLFCEECSSGSYSLQRGFISGLNNTKENKCLKCPYGASCKNGIIKAEENFWGLENNSSSPPNLKFFHCPSEYCGRSSHSTHSDNHSYNSCHGKREGVLCGKCSDGYSEALYSTSCRKNDKCNNNWFWLATGIYVVAFAVYIVFKPPIFSKLLEHTLWFANKPVRSDQQRTCEEDKEQDSGYLKIIFYFHQVVELVMIKTPEKTFHLVPIIPPIIAIFNFQVKSLDGSIGCPFPGLTVVTKELFKCMKFLGTLLSIGLIYAIHRATSRSLHTAPPSMKLYLAVALETLLLGYERLADTSLNLMHCVPVEKDWRLFVDAHIACWQWWQFLLISFIMSFIIPLVLVLFWGSLKLSKDKVTAKEFLIACAFPLPCLLIWFFRKYRKKDDQQMLDAEKVHNAEEIKQVLHGPFRGGSSEDHGTLYWESVLTGRRLILLVIHTFATDPTIRFVCLSCACVIILVHHLTVRPFRERKANICEGFSLLSLVVICMFSLTEATFISQGIDPSGPSKDLFYALQWIEIGLLSLAPLALCLLVVFCAFSQVARLLYHCITYLSRVITRKCCIQESLIPRPLVVDWDSEDFLVIA